MIKTLLSGCNGKMGQVITRIAQSFNDIEITAGSDINSKPAGVFPVYSSPFDCQEKIDVVIDFSHPSAFETILDYCIEKNIPLVMATTGLSQNQKASLERASKTIPTFFSANMSLGINVLVKLVKQAAKLLEGSFDIEIVEKHHNQKIDSPSGTAFLIANSINEVLSGDYNFVYDRHSSRKRRCSNEIGIHTIRGGTIPGDHTVIFAGHDEIIEINHSALSKDVFANGALKAAKFICGKNPGLYSMDDLLNILSQ